MVDQSAWIQIVDYRRVVENFGTTPDEPRHDSCWLLDIPASGYLQPPGNPWTISVLLSYCLESPSSKAGPKGVARMTVTGKNCRRRVFNTNKKGLVIAGDDQHRQVSLSLSQGATYDRG